MCLKLYLGKYPYEFVNNFNFSLPQGLCLYIYIYIRYQGGLGVSTHSKSSSARVHLYYCLSDKYVIKVA